MKLARKLTLAFLLVSLAAVGLAAIFVWATTSSRFSQYLVDRRQQEFINVATDYYREHGSWAGVDEALRSAGLLPPLPQPGTTPPDPQPFALADQNRDILIPGGQYQAGQRIRQGELDRGVQIEIGGVVVGTVLTTGEVPAPNSIEQKYIDSVNRSLLVAGLGAAVLALGLGLLTARSLTRPLRDLTRATQALAQGSPGNRVPVRSKDELGELAASFNKMSAELERLDRSRRQMTADIAHDLRNPLTVIGGYLESIQDGRLEPTHSRLATIQAEVAHLQHLVEDLRTLSLADAGELTLRRVPVPAGELLEHVAALYRPAAEGQSIALEIQVFADLPQLVVDPARIEQVLGNLVGNALRYTPPGGRILLRAEAADGRIALCVQDTGSGIDPADLAHIFERSYRGDAARSGNQSGLGLAIARSLVELHGGTIGVESESGRGSCFTILLPAA